MPGRSDMSVRTIHSHFRLKTFLALRAELISLRAVADGYVLDYRQSRTTGESELDSMFFWLQKEKFTFEFPHPMWRRRARPRFLSCPFETSTAPEFGYVMIVAYDAKSKRVSWLSQQKKKWRLVLDAKSHRHGIRCPLGESRPPLPGGPFSWQLPTWAAGTERLNRLGWGQMRCVPKTDNGWLLLRLAETVSGIAYLSPAKIRCLGKPFVGSSYPPLAHPENQKPLSLLPISFAWRWLTGTSFGLLIRSGVQTR